MTARTHLPGSQAPLWLLVSVHALLILGIFGMHDLIAGDLGGSALHHACAEMSAGATALSADVVHSAVIVTESPNVAMHGGDMTGTMADCRGLMLLCVAIALLVSAFVLLRRRQKSRVLWQTPPPSSTIHLPRLPLFRGLTPLEANSVLRC